MPQLRATEEAIRDVLLVRAIESEDTGAVVLTRDDREYASASALSSTHLTSSAGGRQKISFLDRRAQLILERLVARYPHLERVRIRSRWPHWLSWTLPLAALVIGLATNATEGRQLNILAFPLLGMLAWNLAVYVWLLIAALRRAVSHKRGTAAHPMLRIVEWFVSPPSAQLAAHPTLERAVSRFGREWSALVAKLTHLRASRTLHISAAMFALGIIGGMLARARYTAEYRAGWAGTWAGAEAEIETFLAIVLAPASEITGIELPTIERLRELRGNAENAGDWLILWVVTAALLVIAPRLILALVDGLRSLVLKRRLPVDEDFYVRSVMRNVLGEARAVRVVPYGFELSSGARERLGRMLAQVLGDKTRVHNDPAVAYGEEDDWLAREGNNLRDADQLVLLFNLGSTPEAENHGAFVTGVRQRVDKHAELFVLLDESGFAHKFRGQPSADRRVSERLQAWKVVLARTGLHPIRVSLEADEDEGAARALERAMLQMTATV